MHKDLKDCSARACATFGLYVRSMATAPVQFLNSVRPRKPEKNAQSSSPAFGDQASGSEATLHDREGRNAIGCMPCSAMPNAAAKPFCTCLASDGKGETLRPISVELGLRRSPRPPAARDQPGTTGVLCVGIFARTDRSIFTLACTSSYGVNASNCRSETSENLSVFHSSRNCSFVVPVFSM